MASKESPEVKKPTGKNWEDRDRELLAGWGVPPDQIEGVISYMNIGMRSFTDWNSRAPRARRFRDFNS